MKVLVILLVLVGFVGTSWAQEPDYVLTSFDVILSEDSFTAKGPNHNILTIERNQSAIIDITIQNNDDKPHKITLKNPKPSSNLFDYFVFEPEQIIVPSHQQNSTKLYLKVAENTTTHSSFITFLAQSNTFGMKGIGFVIVVDKEIDELTDKSLRAGLPGAAFPQMNKDISEREAEKMIDNGFGIPTLLPKDYQFQGVTDWGQSQQLLYSPVLVENSTESMSFWETGGMMINYYNYSDSSNINNTKSLPVRIAQDEAQQIMINGMMGMAIEKQTRVIAHSNNTEYDVPAEVEFFDDAKMSLVSLHANMPLDQLLDVASSIPNYEEEHSISDKPNNRIIDLTVRPPLKQIQSGVSPSEIQCKEPLILIQKYDGSPACVMESTKQKLIERGWTDQIPEKTVGLKITNLEVRSTSSFVFNGTTYKPTIPISFNIINPQGTIISTLNKTADEDGSFSVATTTGGSLWKKYNGLYTIIGTQSDNPDYETHVKFELKDGRLVSDPTFYQIQNDNDLLKQNIIRIEDGRISLYPESTCASISLELLAENDIQRYKNDERGLNATNVLPITADDFDEIPILEELIYAVNLLEFPYNKHSSVYMDGLTFVEYEFFLMDKAIQKYGDSQGDYFLNLDSDYEERFSNPKKQGFTNHFIAPLIVYNENVYSIDGVYFWTADEHNPKRMGVYPKDSIGDDEKFIMLTEDDMKSIPKIKQAIKEIGTIKESIHGSKGMSEGTQNEYMQWLKEKSQERLGSDRFRLVEFDNQFYAISFPIC